MPKVIGYGEVDPPFGPRRRRGTDRMPNDPIVTHEQFGSRWDNRYMPGGERHYRLLPLYIKEKLTCFCIRHYLEGTWPYLFDGKRDIYSYCLLCFKPHRYAVAFVYRTCQGCDNFYVPDPRLDRDLKRHDKYRLCPNCDVQPRRVRKQPRRSGFRIS